MSRHPVRLLLAVALTMAGLRWVWNSNDWSGPVLVPLTARHGVHLNDWLTVLLWYGAFALACPTWLRMLAVRVRRLRRQPVMVHTVVTPRAAPADH